MGLGLKHLGVPHKTSLMIRAIISNGADVAQW